MIAQLKLRLTGQIQDISEQSASIFHGVLMDNVDFEYGNLMHESELKPFQQYIKKYPEYVEWTINVLNDAAYNNIIKPLLEDDYKIVELKHKNVQLNISEKIICEKSEEKMIEEIYLANKSSAYISIDFITPTAFKSEGKYIFYPDIKLIYRSLMKKFDSFSEESKLYNSDTLDELVNGSEITYYSLKSDNFSVKANIKAFVGTITIKINGPQMMKNLAHLLFEYGEFSGVGIKCALGMGAIKIKRRRGKID